MAGDKTALIITLLPPLMLSIYRPSFAAGGEQWHFSSSFVSANYPLDPAVPAQQTP